MEQTIGIKEACQYLNIHEKTFYKWVNAGKIPRKKVHRIGRRVYLFKSELHELIKQS